MLQSFFSSFFVLSDTVFFLVVLWGSIFQLKSKKVNLGYVKHGASRTIVGSTFLTNKGTS